MPDAAPVPTETSVSRYRVWLAALVFAGSLATFAWLMYGLGDSFAERWLRVRPGLTTAQIIELLGEPDRKFPPMTLETSSLRDLDKRFLVGHAQWVYEESAGSLPAKHCCCVFFADERVVTTRVRPLPTD